MLRVFSTTSSSGPDPLRMRVARLGQRIVALEQAIALLRLRAVTARELLGAQGKGERPTGGEELQERLITLFDLVLGQVRMRPERPHDGDHAWLQRLFWETREALACCGLRPEFPEGAFDSRMAKAIEVRSAETRDDHLRIAEVVAAAIVRETEQGSQLVRPASVVVLDARVSGSPQVCSDKNKELDSEEAT